MQQHICNEQFMLVSLNNLLRSGNIGNGPFLSISTRRCFVWQVRYSKERGHVYL